MLNRAALILKYKEPFVRWINEADPGEEDPGISLQEANRDKMVYLIDEAAAASLDEWLGLNHVALFEAELEGWYTDESLWPQNLDLELFHQWFEVECHTVLLDVGTEPILDNGY